MRDCENCKHYVDNGDTKGCEVWECEFEEKEEEEGRMKNETSGSISTATILQIVFVILKLCKVIDWSWWWVLSPLWVSIGLVMIVLIVEFILRKRWKL